MLGEPRRAVPHETVEAIIDLVEAHYLHDFFAVQMVFFILVLYTSFSRTECPCPKTYAGREESGEEEDETVSVQYRRPPGPRAGDSPEPLRYWFQAGHRPPSRPPPTPRPPPGAVRAMSPPGHLGPGCCVFEYLGFGYQGNVLSDGRSNSRYQVVLAKDPS